VFKKIIGYVVYSVKEPLGITIVTRPLIVGPNGEVELIKVAFAEEIIGVIPADKDTVLFSPEDTTL
jgi:hypothetical protein